MSVHSPYLLEPYNAVILGQPLKTLSEMETKVLRVLVEAQGRIVTKGEFAAAIYGKKHPDLKILDVFIHSIRQKLRPIHVNWLRTIWGRGHYWSRDPHPMSIQRWTRDRKREMLDLGFYELVPAEFQITPEEYADWRRDYLRDKAKGVYW